MTTTPAQTAETAVAAALSAAALNATVTVRSPDKLARRHLVVSCDDVTWHPQRWLCDVTIDGYVRYGKASRGDSGIAALMDGAIVAVAGTRDTADAHWLGPGGDLAYGEAETVEADGGRYAMATLTATVVVPNPIERDVGDSEAAVRKVLTDAGHKVVDASDVPPFTVTRWAGSAVDDPYSDDVIVQCATEIESGDIEEYVRAVWLTLYESASVVPLEQIDVDHVGTPFGSNGIYETASVTVRVLTPRGTEATS